jgi:PIN domain nuclease of toxin-antitoxin system
MEALRCGWTRDPFDRLIVAQAKANDGAGLVMADTVIRKHYAGAVW